MSQDDESGDLQTEESQPKEASKSSSGKYIKLAILLSIGAAVFFAYQEYGDALSLDYLASKESALREYRENNPVLVYGVALLIYVLATGLSLPGASVLTIAYAWYFGFARGLVLVSFASTGGATMAFLLSRCFLRNTIQSRFAEKLKSFNEALDREGAFYLFTLRLIPAVPFFVINVVMGLTPLKTMTYWWVSQVGMLPGTVVYVYAGSQFPDLKTLAEQGGSGILTPQLVIAFVLLGLFPIAVKKITARWKTARVAKESAS